MLIYNEKKKICKKSSKKSVIFKKSIAFCVVICWCSLREGEEVWEGIGDDLS